MGQLMEDVVSTANNVAENFNRILISHLWQVPWVCDKIKN